MSGIDVTIELPEDETPGELIKGYFTLMRAFGWDLYVTSHFAVQDALGKNWFAARISALKQSDPQHWPPNHKFDPQDPGVILRDYVHEEDSPYLPVFGTHWQQQSAAKKILGTRNTWFHFGDDPTLMQLGEAAKTVRGFVSTGGMHIASRIDKLVERLDGIRTGRYPAAEPLAEPPSTIPPDHDDEIFEATENLARPSIGGTWVGPIPDLRYRITRAGDIIHPDTMQSVRDRVAGDFAAKFRAWTAVEPRGREIWIDADVAIGGFIGAIPRLLGYLGPDPEGDVARGFFTPHYYTIDGDAVVDLDTNDRLKAAFIANVEPGASLRVTTYGDLLAVDDVDGVARIAQVTPDQWFPGHLSA